MRIDAKCSMVGAQDLQLRRRFSYLENGEWGYCDRGTCDVRKGGATGQN